MDRIDLSLLFSRTHSSERSVLSVYLNVDQSHQENLNRGFETNLKKLATSTMRKALADAGERERFASAMRRIKDFVSAYRPAAKAIVLFYDTSDGFFAHYDLGFSVSDQVCWDRELFLQPLANAMDQLEAYGAVLVDRAKLRLFVVSLGRIEEVLHHEFDARQVRRTKGAGTDITVSPSRLQRKADSQVRLNLRHAAKEMGNLVRFGRVHRFVLLGTPEITSELRSILPASVTGLVMGEAVGKIKASLADILSLTRPIAAKYELDAELEKVTNVVTSAAKKERAVVGLGPTLRAVNSGRVWELVYSDNLLMRGYECTGCTALFSARPSRCSYCGLGIRAVTNVVERAVEHALRGQARVEVVTGKASEALKGAGGIGAFLKTRTGSLEA